MNLTRLALSNPVAVVAAILLVLLFGVVSLFRLPVQMIPNIERPLIQINTGWRAAAPEEVEAEILEPQEDALRGLPGARKMEASASSGSASISITFEVDMPLERALIEVMNRLNRVANYPPDVTEPIIYAGRGQFGNAIAWFAIRPLADRTDINMSEQQDFVEEVIQPRVERVAGIANSDVYGGRPSEIRITFDPYRAAAYNIDIPTLATLTGNNVDISAGSSEVGRRNYTVRYAGKYALDDFSNMVLAWRDGSPVRLRDIATVERTLVDRGGILSQNGGASIAFNAQAEVGVNVLQVMDELKIAVEELNNGPVTRAGMRIQQVYDETVYIDDSVSMLRTNLLIGIGLAVTILWWFMRKFRATLVVALAIPISLFVAFTALEISGRTLNIISLAGLAFAMGMVLDSAIIVLENIVRLREQGESGPVASEHGATQVWGALLASTATTVAIFLPIIFLKDVSGQLFADLAFTLATAVVISLIIAVTVIPTAARTWLRNTELVDPHTNWWEGGTNLIMKLTATPLRRTVWFIGLFSAAIGLSLLLLPKPDYLPTGKQNFVFGFIIPPPGQSVDTAEKEFAKVVDQRLMPYINGEQEPSLDMYFLGVFGRFGFMGARVTQPCQPPEDPVFVLSAVRRSLCQFGQMFADDPVEQAVAALNGQVLRGFPDTMAFASRRGIFSNVGAGRGIELNIQSRDLDAMLSAAQAAFGVTMQALPGAQVRPDPGLELAEPELRFVPDERLIVEAGWNRQTMARIIRSLGDGLYVGDYFDGDRRRDIVLRAAPWLTPEELEAMPLATPQLGVVPLSELAKMSRTVGPDQIRRVDRRRAITLQITPPEDMSLQESIDTLKEKVEPVILNILPEDGEVSYYGSADNLRIALENMRNSLLLAVAILYLLICALFRSFKDGLLVVLALPLATVGGVLGLHMTNTLLAFQRRDGSLLEWIGKAFTGQLGSYQPMDLLTMIGFITLLGLVVNNAILLVHQTRAFERGGSSRDDAVRGAVRIRLRPILMSTLTSLFGMLPLLLIPGPGTELYRGLAAVIVGGLSVSTVFTLVLLPSLLRATFLDDLLARLGRLFGLEQPAPAAAGAGGGLSDRVRGDGG
ncbi:MAG: efflux RND transporter permease subunit [Gammaproteobacteria bacterium]|nr:efflux RND transporter permease subunit [Gammaproteobacteria bacterium]NNF61947.1 efflux RND transporter permease subunit [Gammaproteobacteria bacterium]